MQYENKKNVMQASDAVVMKARGTYSDHDAWV